MRNFVPRTVVLTFGVAVGQIIIFQGFNAGGNGLKQLKEPPVRAVRDTLVYKFDLFWRNIVAGSLEALVPP